MTGVLIRREDIDTGEGGGKMKIQAIQPMCNEGRVEGSGHKKRTPRATRGRGECP